jgi:hypothetical protein
MLIPVPPTKYNTLLNSLALIFSRSHHDARDYPISMPIVLIFSLLGSFIAINLLAFRITTYDSKILTYILLNLAAIVAIPLGYNVGRAGLAATGVVTGVISFIAISYLTDDTPALQLFMKGSGIPLLIYVIYYLLIGVFVVFAAVIARIKDKYLIPMIVAMVLIFISTLTVVLTHTFGLPDNDGSLIIMVSLIQLPWLLSASTGQYDWLAYGN